MLAPVQPLPAQFRIPLAERIEYFQLAAVQHLPDGENACLYRVCRHL